MKIFHFLFLGFNCDHHTYLIFTIYNLLFGKYGRSVCQASCEVREGMRQASFREAGDKSEKQFLSKMIQIRIRAMKTINRPMPQRVAQWVKGPPRGSPSILGVAI